MGVIEGQAAITATKPKKPAPAVYSTPAPSVPTWDDPYPIPDFSQYVQQPQLALGDLSMQRLGLGDITKTSFTNVAEQEKALAAQKASLADLQAGMKLSQSGSTKGMDAALAAKIAKLNAAMKAAGFGNFRIVSGFRTYAQQADLYKKYLAGTGNKAAKPGHSNHEKGLAVDINWSELSSAQRKWLNANLSAFGLVRPVKGEMWHLQHGGAA